MNTLFTVFVFEGCFADIGMGATSVKYEGLLWGDAEQLIRISTANGMDVVIRAESQDEN